ncbi:MAG: hypothetical protein JW808_02920 [Victivallales bacterium]|nr:hypothetical protein [Victivallales bacterium]
MKKLTLVISVVLMMSYANVASAQVRAGETILLYIPNRLMDFADMFSVTLGFGPAIGIEGQVTESLSLGGDVGPTAQMIKGINRQYGFAVQNGWNASFLMISAEERDRSQSIGSAKDYYYYSTGVPSMDKIPYDPHKGTKDFWAVGGKLKALIDAQFYLHPIEIADFVLGWLFIDIRDDDKTPDEIKR